MPEENYRVNKGEDLFEIADDNDWDVLEGQEANIFVVESSLGFNRGSVAVDGGSKAGGGWFFSPGERRFVNRPKTL